MQVILDGQPMPQENAVVPVTDRGFLYGDAAFETLAVRAGRPFRLVAHLDRLADSLRALRIAHAPGRERLQHEVHAVIDANRLEDGLVRITVTRGSGPRGPSIRGVGAPTVLVAAHPRAAHVDSLAEQGAALALAALRRVPAACLPAHAKHANYLSSVLALAQAQAEGGDGVYDALLLTLDGQIAEGSFSNVFFVRGGRLHTPAPSLGILPGVTRAAVLELARRRRLGVFEGAFELVELLTADELFLTNTGAGVMPVAWLGATRFPSPGPITALLRADYERLVHDECTAPSGSPPLIAPKAASSDLPTRHANP